MKNNKGYFLIEALLSIVIFSMIILSLFSMINFLQRRAVQSTFETDAGLLLQDGMEIAHSSLLSDWAGYSDGTYYPVFDVDANSWILIEGEETGLEVIFTRKIEIKRVCRNVNTGERIEFTNICTGEIDPNSRVVKTIINWVEDDQAKEIGAELLVLNVVNK